MSEPPPAEPTAEDGEHVLAHLQAELQQARAGVRAAWSQASRRDELAKVMHPEWREGADETG